MKKALLPEEFYHLINHGPCVLITSGSLTKNRTNIAPIAWLTPLNDVPPLVIICVATSHYTTELINETGEFVINIVSKDLLQAIKICGSISGRKIDKFKKSNLTKVESQKVNVPYIKESIGHIECKVIDKKEYNGVTLFVGKVLYCKIEKELYDSYLITEKAKTPHHVGGGYFIISSKRIKV